MSHHHEHGHEHDHDHSHETSLSEKDKLLTMVRHWIHHNEDHARSYRDWASRLRGTGREEAARILEEVASGNQAQNEQLQRIITLLNAE